MLILVYCYIKSHEVIALFLTVVCFRKLWERFLEICNKQNSLYGITWNHLRSQLDGVEMKKTYVLNPLAPEFVPNRLRHGVENIPPEPIAVGKYGHYFAPPPPTWGYRHPYMTPHHGLPGQVSKITVHMVSFPRLKYDDKAFS